MSHLQKNSDSPGSQFSRGHVRRKATFAAISMGLLLLSGCKSHLSKAEKEHIEKVMTPGMTITATTKNGKIVIRADNDLGRSYQFDSQTLSVTMWPRTERWYGSLGLYYPAPSLGIWPRSGIYRAVVEEGQQHFSSETEALDWLSERKWMPFTYRTDGLVVGWGTMPSRHQVNVEVWQLLINKRKPENLKGGDDASILSTH